MGAAFKKKFFFFLYSSHRGRVELSESVRSRLKELRPFDFRSFACPILWNSFTLARTVLWDIPFVRCLGFQPCEYIYIYVYMCMFLLRRPIYKDDEEFWKLGKLNGRILFLYSGFHNWKLNLCENIGVDRNNWNNRKLYLIKKMDNVKLIIDNNYNWL